MSGPSLSLTPDPPACKSLVVPEQLVDILCNQNIVGDDDLEDDSAVDEGVEFTNMINEMFENESDEEN